MFCSTSRPPTSQEQNLRAGLGDVWREPNFNVPSRQGRNMKLFFPGFADRCCHEIAITRFPSGDDTASMPGTLARVLTGEVRFASCEH